MKKRVYRPGDGLETLLGGIPGVKRLPCYGQDGKLRPESGCAKRRDWLNRKSAELTMRGTENNNG